MCGANTFRKKKSIIARKLFRNVVCLIDRKSQHKDQIYGYKANTIIFIN